MMNTLEVRGMTIRFGGLTAVNKVDFSVARGQIFSIIGPNGAGKTTVFNGVTAIYEPNEGEILFEGRPVRRRLTWKVIAVCAMVGLTTGIATMLFASDVDTLWRVSIKTNYDPVSRRMEWSRAWRDTWRYLRGEIQVQPYGDGAQILTFDKAKELARTDSVREAEARRADYERVLFADESQIRKTPEGWTLAGVLTFGSRQAALNRIKALNRFRSKTATHRWLVPLLAVLGCALGGAGAYVTWARTRRTPDLVSQSGMARTFQNIRLFHNMTVAENVQVALESRGAPLDSRLVFLPPRWRPSEAASRAKAMELLDFVNLRHRADQLAKNLPYGEQRRLEIARALATSPRLLLLDEPAAGMNPSESRDLMKLIQRIRDGGRTVLLIEHHMKVVMGISDRIVVLDHGVKIAEGGPQEIQNDPKVLEAYLGREEIE